MSETARERRVPRAEARLPLRARMPPSVRVSESERRSSVDLDASSTRKSRIRSPHTTFRVPTSTMQSAQSAVSAAERPVRRWSGDRASGVGDTPAGRTAGGCAAGADGVGGWPDGCSAAQSGGEPLSSPLRDRAQAATASAVPNSVPATRGIQRSRASWLKQTPAITCPAYSTSIMVPRPALLMLSSVAQCESLDRPAVGASFYGFALAGGVLEKSTTGALRSVPAVTSKYCFALAPLTFAVSACGKVRM